MIKIASDEAREVIGQFGPALRAQQMEIQALRTKLAEYEKYARVTKLASEMQQKGLDPDVSYEDQVDRLMQATNLAVVEEAVRMGAPQVKVAELADRSGNPADATAMFEALIIGD